MIFFNAIAKQFDHSLECLPVSQASVSCGTEVACHICGLVFKFMSSQLCLFTVQESLRSETKILLSNQ